MLPGEEKLEKTKKKVSRPQWTHVRTITADVLRKMIEAENESREAQVESDRSGVRASVLAGSKLFKLFGHMKGITIEVDYEPPSYKDADASLELKVGDDDDDEGIDGELTEYIKLPAGAKKTLRKLETISKDEKTIKEAAQTIAAYVILDLEKDPGADLLGLISQRTSEWVKSQ